MKRVLVLSLFVVVCAVPAMASPLALQIQTIPGPATYSGTGPAAEITGTTWNAWNASTVKDSNGNVLPGVAIKTGCFFLQSTPWYYGWANIYNFTFAPDTYPGMSALQNSDLIRQAAYRPDDIGIGVSGLPAGTYKVYSLNTLLNYPVTQQINIGLNGNGPTAGGLAETYAWSDIGMNAWTDGRNYVAKTVTVSGPSDWITVFTSAGGSYVSSNGIQIVAVPEPATMSLLALGGLGALIRRRK